MNRVDTFEKNINGKDFVVGDIHGCFSLLIKELKKLNFDFENDRLFATGDLVDRGPESHLAEEFLEYPWFFSVMGNHEQMTIQYADGYFPPNAYIHNGGVWNVFNSKEQVNRIADVLRQLPVAIEVETDYGVLGIVHADVPFADWISFKEKIAEPNVIEAALWRRARINAIEQYGHAMDIKGIDGVVFGHSPVSSPLFYKNTVYLDTGAGYSDPGCRLSILSIDSVFNDLTTS